MDKSTILREPESAPAGVSEIPGEPAIIINGLPPPPLGFTIPTASACGASSGGDPVGFGEWMEGREVRKLFGGEFYGGTVAEFDKKAGWYKVVYEDGDYEDLTWDELQEIVLPLDVAVPLKSLAMKLLKKGHTGGRGPTARHRAQRGGR